MVGPLALVALVASSTNADTRCTLPLDAGTVELELVGTQWDDWEDVCEELAPHLDPGPPPWTDTATEERLLGEPGYFVQSTCTLSSADRMRCRVVPARMVREVEIDGSLPFIILSEDVRRRMFLHPGTLLKDEVRALDLQRRRLEEYFVREGYFGTEVEIRTEMTDGAEPNQGVRIIADIDAGPSHDIRNITIRGDSTIDQTDIEDELIHWGELFFYKRRFRPEQFETDLDGIADMISLEGWPSVRLSGRYEVISESEEVDIFVDVESGPKLTLAFDGNQAFDDEDLTELATFYTVGAMDGVEIDKTVAAIKKEYQRDGYDRVQIDATSEKTADGVCFRFTIDEGKETDVAEVSIVGADHFTADEVIEGAALVTKTSGVIFGGYWVDEFVARDRRAIEALYRNDGFAVVAVKSRRVVDDEGRLEVVFDVSEGPRRSVGEVTVEGLPPEVDPELADQLSLRVGAPLNEGLLARDRREILARLAAYGYTNATVARKMKMPFRTEAGEATIRYVVTPGPQAKLGGVLVRGNFRTDADLIEQEMGIEPGEPMDLATLGQAKRQLRGLGIFRTVQLSPLGAFRDDRDPWVLVGVEEREVLTLDLVLSFSSKDGFGIGADFRDRNLFGRAMELSLSTRLSNATGLGHKDARIGNRDLIEARLFVPRPLGLDVDSEYHFAYDLEDQKLFRDRKWSVGTTWSRRLLHRSLCGVCPTVRVSLGYELVSRKLDTRAGSKRSAIPGATVGKIVPRLSYERLDSVTDPRNGFIGETRFELASSVMAGPLPDWLDDDQQAPSFWRFRSKLTGYLTLGVPFTEPFGDRMIFGGPVVGTISARVATARPFGSSTTVPESETYAYGGALSVRGAEERASVVGLRGAEMLTIANAELRWYFLQNLFIGHLQIAAFADVGTAAYNFGQLFDDYTLSVGGALRYVTPIGPLSLSYGVPVVRSASVLAAAAADPKIDPIPKHGRVHFSFGYTF